MIGAGTFMEKTFTVQYLFAGTPDAQEYLFSATRAQIALNAEVDDMFKGIDFMRKLKVTNPATMTKCLTHHYEVELWQRWFSSDIMGECFAFGCPG